jgi:hypothetical protein
MSKKTSTTSAMIFKAISRQPVQQSLDETLYDIETREYHNQNDDNENEVYQAFIDLVEKPQRFYSLPDNPSIIECPRARLLRIGEAAKADEAASNAEQVEQVEQVDDAKAAKCTRAIEEGKKAKAAEAAKKNNKSSELYALLMELTQDGVKLPHVSARALSTAQKRLTIANAFVAFMAKLPPLTTNFMEAKRHFRKSLELAGSTATQTAVDDALAAHNLEWSSYDIKWIPKKRKKREEGISCRNLCMDYP